MKKLYLLIIFLYILSYNIQGQQISVGNVVGLPCSYVQVDITASGFSPGVGSVSLYINFTPNVIQYVKKISGTIPAGVNQVNNQIVVIWSNEHGAIINGTLVSLILHYHGGSTLLDPDELYCELTDTLLNPIVPTYINGSVNPGSYTFNTYYVDAGVSASGDGLSWGTAKKTIREATNLALKPGEQVWIKPGTYAETDTIKTSGGISVWPQVGVILSDTNKITFPNGANLSCVDLVNYPNQYYAYVYRSWNSNNGYYKVTEVNDAQNYVRVEGASFIPETGSNNRGKVMAAVGRPIIWKKDPSSSESQRVIINTSALGGTADALYIGKPTDATTADSANWNIFQGIDITTGNSKNGLRIICSSYNVFANGRIYSSATAGSGFGAIITGISTKIAKYNIFQNNQVYNFPYVGIVLGYTTNQIAFNYSYFNHVIDNNFYLSGAGYTAKFNNAVKVGYNNKSNVIDGNNFHDMSLLTVNNGALFIESKTDSTLVERNIFRNIGRVAVGTNACIMVMDSTNKLNIFNNIIYNDDTVTNAVYAFRINGKKHSGSKVAFNTIYKIDNGFYLEDPATPATTLDFGIQNNIISPTLTAITNSGTTGRYTVTYNLFRVTPGAPYASGTGNIIGNPLFIDPNGTSMFGLMLQPTSPAIDTGTVITNISRDYIGDIRGTPEPTLGAFENTMSCTWTGTTSTDWHTASNWLYGIVPQNYMRINIPNVINDPVVSFNNATCKSITLSPGAVLRIVPPRTITLNN
jgi:hypothetical protein